MNQKKNPLDVSDACPICQDNGSVLCRVANHPSATTSGMYDRIGVCHVVCILIIVKRLNISIDHLEARLAAISSSRAQLTLAAAPQKKFFLRMEVKSATLYYEQNTIFLL